MKNTIEYLAKAIEYLEKCELESPYKNAVDIKNAKVAIQVVELEHKIEEAKQLNHLADAEDFKKERDVLLKQITPKID
ncbi:MAG: hypothetical protein ABFS32_13845 [Bacteroidota bacterium]